MASLPPAAVGAGDTALSLNGTSQYATLGASGASADLRSATFTVELWFKRTGAGVGTGTGNSGIASAIPLITKGRAEAETTAADINYFLGIDATTGTLVADFEEAPAGSNVAGLNHPVAGTTAIAADGAWHHAAATYDGATWFLYLDGVQDGTLAVNEPANALTESSTAVGSARTTAGSAAGFFAGVVDEVRIWDHARTQPEIAAAKDAEITSAQSGLLGVWNLNEGTGTSLADSSGHAVTGAAVNGPAWVDGFVPPAAGNTAPDAPVLNAPADAATGIGTSPTLDVDVSDPEADALTVTYFGRPFASGVFAQIGQETGVASGGNSTVSWTNIGAGQTFEWYVTVNDGNLTTTGPTWTFHTASGDPVFVGAGDIADCGRTQDEATGAVIGAIDGTVWTAGDNVYPHGVTLSNYTTCYESGWGGAIKARTRPVPGNHDWGTGQVSGGSETLAQYFTYFGANATDADGNSYYSYDIASSNWHVVNLDSECQLVPGGCGAGSAQELWLKADLAANSTKNVIAIWHKPRFSSGVTNYTALQTFYQDLYDAGADILLDGHDHIYEQLRPMDPTGSEDAIHGIRQFTVGVGGASLQSCPATWLPSSEVCHASTFGVLKLTLHATTYDWQFLPMAGQTFTDSGTASVHDAPGAGSTYADIPVSASTGEKPQSKAWEHGGTWWAVLPSTTASPSGTWVWRLEGDDTWSPVLKISDSTDAQADVKVVGEVAHVLLHDASPELVSIQYDTGGNTYEPWSTRSTSTGISLPGSEIATIDIDSDGRMWLATETSSTIDVYYSDSPYSSFSGPITLASGINGDDIAVVTALPDDTIGVLWSNQNTERFGFRVHADGADPATWAADEVPASGSALNVGLGMADDHLNLAVAADGTLYAAVKTSYDTAGYPKIALLIRRPSGDWDPLYPVDEAGTRGIVLLNEADATVRVVYTSSEGYNDIVTRSSPTASISFGPQQLVMSGGLNDVTSTKSNWTDQVLVLASSATQASHAFLVAGPTTDELRGQWLMDEGSGSTIIDNSGLGNDGALQGNPTWVAGQHSLALRLDGTGDYATVPDDASLDISDAITIAAWVRPETVGTQYLVKKATQGGVGGYELSLSTAGKAFVRFNQVPSGNTYRIDSTSDYPVDGSTWIHLAATYDGTTMRLYVNGVEEGSIAGPASISTNSLDLAIGAQPDAVSQFQGALDDVLLYGRALSAPEIAALASAGTGNQAPTATADAFTTSVDSARTEPAPGVLANDTDADADPLTAVLDTDVSHGSLSLAGDGGFTYTPTAGYSGPDSFTYHATDGTDDSSSVTVSLTVTAGNSAIDFGGSAYVTFGDPEKLDLDEFTVETWFMRTGPGTPNTTGSGGITLVPLLTHGAPEADNSNLDANWILGIAGDVIAADFEDDASGGNHPISGTSIITDDVWHHAAATFDGTTWAVYLDGNLEASVTPGVAPRSDSVQRVALGAMITSADAALGRFEGVIDEARVWDHARSIGEIQADKNNELTSGTGLAARWGLNEASGASAGDTMPLPANGSITGTGYSWVAGFVPPVGGNTAPDAPTLNAPANGGTGIGTSPTLDVGVSDTDGDPLTVTFFGRPFASGVFAQIAQHAGVTGTGDTAVWANLGAGQTFEWYVTVNDGSLTTTGPTWTFHTTPSVDPVFVGVGDVASCSVTTDTATGNIIKEIDGHIFTTGDNVYSFGTADEFANCYAPTPWGDPSVLSRTRPVPGNHDWGTGGPRENLVPYFDFYGSNATDADGNSYYSYDIPSSNWHIVNLDSECQLVPGGCGAASPQVAWLKADLAANAGKNVIAIWHKPRYSSGQTNLQAMQPMWDALYAAGVDILLDGHDHIYESTVPMKSGATLSDPPVADPNYGIRLFTVGTGGESHHGLGTQLPTTIALSNEAYGIFKLTLHATTYDWQFLPIVGTTFTDSGTGTVHDAPPNTDLVVHWPMDETSGSTIHDTGAAPANDATTVAGPTWVSGMMGNGLHFNGTTQYATTPDEASLDITNAITIAAWVKPEKVGSSNIPQQLVQKARTGVTSGFEIGLTGATSTAPQKAYIRFNEVTNFDQYRVTSTTVYPTDGNTWIHVAGTWDGTTIRFYYNGVQQGTPVAFAGPIAANNLPIGIGGAPTFDASRLFQGALDDVRIYNRALSASEIAALAAPDANTAPVADDGAISIHAGASMGGMLSASDADSDPITYAIVNPPTQGSVSLDDPSTGAYTYVSDSGATGTDSFTFKVNDGTADSNVATVTVTVLAGQGYWLVAGDGGIFTFGDAGFYGSTGGQTLDQPVVGMAPTPTRLGYWLVASDGGIFTFGDAGFFGSAGGTGLTNIVGMAATPSGLGYWLVGSDGEIYAFGDAVHLGSMGGQPLNQPVVGMAATPSGNGYWLVASDGGIFTFGDAAFLGSTGGQILDQPVVGMAATPSGNGYWLVASDGGIFTFGDAGFFGSTGGQPLDQPVVGMAATPSGNGYWLVASDGGIFTFGDAGFYGSMGGQPLFELVVSMGY